jgi:hypothetical protein
MTLSISDIRPKADEFTASNDGRVTALIGGPRKFEFDTTALDFALASYEAGAYGFCRTYKDHSAQKISFNVMPDRQVSESLTPQEYSVGRRIARVVFNREYETQMEKSPSHLVFISALVQWQKLVYLAMCEEHGIDYDPAGRERFKIWPTDIRCFLPVLVREEEGLVQDTVIYKCENASEDKWTVEAFSTVNARLGFLARASVYRLDIPHYGGPGWTKKSERTARAARRDAAASPRRKG